LLSTSAPSFDATIACTLAATTPLQKATANGQTRMINRSIAPSEWSDELRLKQSQRATRPGPVGEIESEQRN
jgi:hypothetical protein